MEKWIVQDRILLTSKRPKFPHATQQVSQPHVFCCKYFKIFSNDLIYELGQQNPGYTILFHHFPWKAGDSYISGTCQHWLDCRTKSWEDLKRLLEINGKLLVMFFNKLSISYWANYQCGPVDTLLKDENSPLSSFHHVSKDMKYLFLLLQRLNNSFRGKSLTFCTLNPQASLPGGSQLFLRYSSGFFPQGHLTKRINGCWVVSEYE